MDKHTLYRGHKGSGKSETEMLTVIENLFYKLPPQKAGKDIFVVGRRGAAKSFYFNTIMAKIKPVSNNWRKMHGKPMLRKRNGMKRTKYWQEQLSFIKE